jgi:histidinol dehydrogenase
MMEYIDLRKKENYAALLRARSTSPETGIEKIVIDILDDVRKHGDDALRKLTKQYDKAKIGSISVPQKEIANALSRCDKKFIAVIRRAAVNIAIFHKRQLHSNWVLPAGHGSSLHQIYTPLDKVGIYVPGGKAAYVSTVLMNAIPAIVAGVKEIHLVSPVDRSGKIHPDILAAAAILKIHHVYKVGGAQAIAALAYGTETVPAVDKIVGPGNIFVAMAKRLVFGQVGIDSFAGPSEVAILADDTARPDYIAADMLAQAEHDELASSILVTTSKKLGTLVVAELEKMAYILERREIATRSLRTRGAVILVKNLDQGVRVINHLAPEHLEIITKHPVKILRKIRHASSIFLGNYSPVALGDYFAGPNHVLPTGGTARFSSPLSVDDFVKKSSVISYSQKAMIAVIEDIALFAEREGLQAHALSVRIRKK